MKDKRCGTCTFAEQQPIERDGVVRFDCTSTDERAEANFRGLMNVMEEHEGTNCPCWKEATDATER